VYLPVDHRIRDNKLNLVMPLLNRVTLIQLTRLAGKQKAAIARAEANLRRFWKSMYIAREIHDTLAQGASGRYRSQPPEAKKISSAQLGCSVTIRSPSSRGRSPKRSVRALRQPLESATHRRAFHLAEQMTCAPATQITVQIEGSLMLYR